MLAGNRNADTFRPLGAGTARSERLSLACGSGSLRLIVPPASTNRRADSTLLFSWHNAPAHAAQMRLPLFCGDLLHNLDLQVALGDQLLEACILSFEFTKPSCIRHAHPAESL